MTSLYQSGNHVFASYIYQKLRDLHEEYIKLADNFTQHKSVIYSQLRTLETTQIERSKVINKFDKLYTSSWSNKVHFPTSIHQYNDLQVLDQSFPLLGLADLSKIFTQEFLLLKPEDFLNNTEKVQIALEAIDNILIPHLKHIQPVTKNHSLSNMPIRFAEQVKDNINFELLQARQYDNLLVDLLDQVLLHESKLEDLKNDLQRFQKKQQILVSKSQFQQLLSGQAIEVDSEKQTFCCHTENFTDNQLYLLEEGLSVEITLNKQQVLIQVSSEN